MLWPVRLVLALLRAASEALFFLEAQRLLSRFVRPTSAGHAARAEERLLRSVRARTAHRFVASGAWRLHTIVAGDERAGAAIVCLHGHSMSGAFYYRNLDDMVAMGYCAYAVDLLGWGRSDRPRFRGGVDDMLDWYLEALERWRVAVGLDRFVLVGHSLGAYLAMMYAARYEARVTKLMLISPAAITSKLSLTRALYFKLSPHTVTRRGGLLGFLLFFFNYPSSYMYVKDCLRAYCYHLSAALPPSGDLSVAPMIRFSGLRSAEVVRPLIQNLAMVSMPIQIVCGETDRSMPIEDVHLLYHEMHRRGFKVKLDVIPGTDHCPHLEDPDGFYSVLSNFAHLKDHAADGALLEAGKVGNSGRRL